jgi:hypothetical protein
MAFSPQISLVLIFIQSQLNDRDFRRSAPLVDWLLALPLEFQGESAFTSKSGASPTYCLNLQIYLFSE